MPFAPWTERAYNPQEYAGNITAKNPVEKVTQEKPWWYEETPEWATYSPLTAVQSWLKDLPTTGWGAGTLHNIGIGTPVPIQPLPIQPSTTVAPPNPKETIASSPYVPWTESPYSTGQTIDLGGGQKVWWNEFGNNGIGGWEPWPTSLSSEQQMYQYGAQQAFDWNAMMAQLAGQRGIAELDANTRLRLAELQRQLQAQQAAEQMAQMYASEPYKYWAQMGTPTPEAVARLTGGRVSSGQQMQRGVPLSTPATQWWNNLLPSETQQILGAVNWLGVNPEDYLSMYQRMVPGLGARQVEPRWAR